MMLVLVFLPMLDEISDNVQAALIQSQLVLLILTHLFRVSLHTPLQGLLLLKYLTKLE